MRRKKYPCQGVKVVTCLYLLANLATGQVQNMLNNGGFESGLMCYNTSVWNTTGDPFASDYQFTLSPDSHSGGYSLAISCVTPNCVKAAIASSRIPTLASQSYKLSLYAKCPAGSEGYAFIPEVAGGTGYLYQKLSCTGAWTLNAVNFTVPSTATDFSFSVYNFDTRPLQVDDVLLTYSDGTVPQHPVLHPGNRSISISGQNMNVDGKPYFALGFIDVRYADIGSVAATGANTIFGFGNSGNQNCFNTAQENYLDLAYDNGLNFIPNSTSTARMGFPGIFSNVAAQFPPHKANIAWFLADEVDQYVVPLFTIPAATVVAEYQTLAPLAGVPLFENFQRAAWSVPGDDQAYSPGTDIWMAEPFGTDFTQIPHAVKLFNSIAPKPIWLAEDDIDSTMIVPKAYYGAISGATGLHYYTWDAFKSQPDKLAAVTQAFSELKQLTPAIFGAKLAVTASAEIAALGRSLNGSQYILAANPFQTNVQSVFTVAGLTTGTPVQVMFENRTILASQGGFQDAFAGISRHAYLISPITSKQIPQIIWPTPAAIVSGTPLSATQLNAQSNVPGTFTYNPAAGAILAAGTQTLTASFTPTDSSTYSGVSASVNIVVTPAVVGGSLPNGEFISPNTGSLNPGTPQNFQLTWASAAGQSQIYSGNILIQDSTAPAPTSGATFANSCLIRVYSFGSAQLVDDAGVVNSSPIWFGNSWAFSPSNSHCSVDGPNSWLPTVASSTASGATLQTTVRLTINQSWAGRTLTFWLQGGNANYAVGGWQQLGTMTVIGSNPSFTMGATAAAAVAGASGSSTVTVTPANGFASPVTLNATGWPTGVTGTFGTNPATASSNLTLNVASSLAPGSYSLPITGTSQSLTANTNIALTVSAAPSFTLGATAAAVIAGSSGSSTVTVTGANGFASSVTLSATGWPTGVTGTFGTNPATTSSTVAINVASSVAPGSYSLPVTGASQSLTANTNIVVTVSPVSGGTLPSGVSMTPNTGSVFAGSAQNYQFTWSSPAGQPAILYGNILIQDSAAPAPTNGGSYASACYLSINTFGSAQLADDYGSTATSPNIWLSYSWATSPANTHCTVNGPASLIPTVTNAGATLQSTVNLAFNPSWAGRTLTIWLQGGNTNYKFGAWQQSGTMTVGIASPSFTLGATAASIKAGATGASTVTVTPANGFASPVTLSATGWPTGITGTFGTNPATGSSTVSISVGSSVIAGSYSLPVTGASQLLTATTNMALTVTAATGGTLPSGISVTPNTGSVSAATPQNFQLAWSSPTGQSPILYGNVLIQDSAAPAPTSGGSYPNACYVSVNTYGSAQLGDDTGSTAIAPNIWPGYSWSISPSNAHCTVNGPASALPAVTNAGTTLQATVNVALNTNWAGKTLTIWLQGGNANYKLGGWQQMGTITVH